MFKIRRIDRRVCADSLIRLSRSDKKCLVVDMEPTD